MSERVPTGGGEAGIERRKREINGHVTALLKPGAPLQEIARLLGAEDLLQTVRVRGRNEPVLRFDAHTYVQREAEKQVSLRLPDEFIKLQTTIIPPDEGETFQPGEGSGIEKKQIIPRSRYLAELLTELNQPYRVVIGRNAPDMVRVESYQAFLIPGLKRMVLVNDEEGNATFVILVTEEDRYASFMELSKDELRGLGEEKVQTFKYFGDPIQWKSKLRESLTMKFQEDEAPEGNPFIQKASAGEHVERKPAGWMHEMAASLHLGITRSRAAALIERALRERPEWTKKYRSEKGQALMHYHPDLIEHLRNVLEQEPKLAPQGWKMNTQLAEELNVNPQTTQRLIDAYRETHPESWVSYLSEGSHIRKFASPELVRIVRENIEKRVTPPEGWKNASELMDPLRAIRTEDVRGLAEMRRAEHSEWFKVYANKKRMLEEYYHPSLVAIVEQDILKKPTKAPPGWMNFQALADELGKDREVVERLIERQRLTHPGWLQPYLSYGGVGMHAHPDLVALIRKEVTEREGPPAGWKGITAVSEEAGTEPLTVRRWLERSHKNIRTTRPEWFGMYMNQNGKLVEFIHPDLVKAIVDELSRREVAPEGWMSVLSLSNELKNEARLTGNRVVSSRRRIKDEMEKYRLAHPEWFKKFKPTTGRGPFGEHYHPDLIKRVKEDLAR